jgi:hypothetical protein
MDVTDITDLNPTLNPVLSAVSLEAAKSHAPFRWGHPLSPDESDPTSQLRKSRISSMNDEIRMPNDERIFEGRILGGSVSPEDDAGHSQRVGDNAFHF